MYPHGGFKTQTVRQLGNVLAAFNAGRISLRGLRLYFALLAAVAAREAAQRCRKKIRRKPSGARFLTAELARLCGCPERSARRELRALERAGLVLFSESAITFTECPLPGSCVQTALLACGRPGSRPVPLPRPVLRFIAGCTKVATIKTMLAYCVRGLSLTRAGDVKGKGTAKASWIASTLGISLRAVRGARAELIAAGFITRDEGSVQWKLNRDGAYFSVNMSFGAASTRIAAVDRSGWPVSTSAPLPAQNDTRFAPPYKDKKTPCGLKNQKTRDRETNGFLRGGESGKVLPPCLRRIQALDLCDTSRLLKLFEQAVAEWRIANSESGRLAFVAAAEHARRVAKWNAPGLLRAIVCRGLWHFVSQQAEDAARLRLQALQRPKSGERLTSGQNTAGEIAKWILRAVCAMPANGQTPKYQQTQPVTKQDLAPRMAFAALPR